MSSLLSILHKNEAKIQNKNVEDFSENEDTDRESMLVSKNFDRIINELNQAKCKNSIEDNQKISVDPITKIPMEQIDIGLKNFDFAGTNVEISPDTKTFDDFAPNKKMLLLKFKRKNDKNIMSMQEIRKYIDIRDGEVVFIQKVTPEIIYKIAKSLNQEFYFIANHQDNVIPLSKWQAEEIFAKRNKITLNEKMHIENIVNEKGDIQKPIDIQSAFQSWFGKKVRHMHPYAYSDMVITQQIKHHEFIKKGSNGRNLIVKTQFSNELTDKYISLNRTSELEEFAYKCREAFHKATTFGEEHIFALPFPLYSKNHMLSLVIAFRPDGKIKATIINANGRKDAKERYAVPIGNILQKTFERYAPNVAKNIEYFFHENNSQFGGTCMTHADCITKQLVKDPDFEYDGRELHPIKIWEKAYIRGFATTLYQHARKQNKFIPDDTREVRNENDDNEKKTKTTSKQIINRINTNKQQRNSYEKSNERQNNVYKNKNNKIKTEKPNVKRADTLLQM